jgi:hypothetical protein
LRARVVDAEAGRSPSTKLSSGASSIGSCGFALIANDYSFAMGRFYDSAPIWKFKLLNTN